MTQGHHSKGHSPRWYPTARPRPAFCCVVSPTYRPPTCRMAGSLRVPPLTQVANPLLVILGTWRSLVDSSTLRWVDPCDTQGSKSAILDDYFDADCKCLSACVRTLRCMKVYMTHIAGFERSVVGRMTPFDFVKIGLKQGRSHEPVDDHTITATTLLDFLLIR